MLANTLLGGGMWPYGYGVIALLALMWFARPNKSDMPKEEFKKDSPQGPDKPKATIPGPTVPWGAKGKGRRARKRENQEKVCSKCHKNPVAEKGQMCSQCQQAGNNNNGNNRS